jgi:putative nucleotidyltransferase with HDIG domain
LDGGEASVYNVANRTRALTALVLAWTAISIAHFAVGAGTHGLHVIHIVLAGLYLPVIIAAIIWFGIAGAFVSATAVTALYIAYVLVVWPNQPMENANQYGMVTVYWVVAITTGALVRLREAERQRHLAAERAADRRSIIEAIAALSNALRARDEYTREHSEHVAALAVGIGRELGFSADRIELTRLAALVHDIGKIGVRDDVLLKPGELSEDERNSVQRHPTVAADILRTIHGAQDIADIVIAHHECPDGSGYPSGLKGEAIPTEARVVRVADVYASLVERRPYKEAMDPTSAVGFISQGAGSKYDHESIAALRRMLKM